MAMDYSVVWILDKRKPSSQCVQLHAVPVIDINWLLR